MHAHPLRLVESPTPHPSRDEALVRGWTHRYRTWPRLAMLGLLGAVAFCIAVPARGTIAGALGSGTHLVLVAALGTMLAVPACELLALRLHAVHWPDRRKAPARPTPRMGALAVGVGVFLAVAVAGDIPVSLGVALGGALLIVGVGLGRDVGRLPAAWLHGALGLAALLAALAGVQLPLMPPSMAGAAVVNALLGCVWLVAVGRGLGRLDRVDGMAAGLGAMAAVGLVASQGPSPATLALLGACLGFLPANLRPGGAARLYLGRGGAPALGFLLAALAGGADPARGGLGLVPALLILALPLYELGRRVLAALARAIAPWSAPEREPRALADALASLLRSGGRAVAAALLLAAVWIACALSLTSGGAPLIAAVQAGAALLVLVVLDRAGSRLERRNPR